MTYRWEVMADYSGAVGPLYVKHGELRRGADSAGSMGSLLTVVVSVSHGYQDTVFDKKCRIFPVDRRFFPLKRFCRPARVAKWRSDVFPPVLAPVPAL
jgi:hypothetical protein